MEKKPKFIVLGGVNGAGKSTVRDNYIIPNESEVVVIDPDKLSKKFQAQGMDVATADRQGGREAINLFEQAIKDKKDIFLETTLSGHSIFNRYDKAKQNGYETTTVYVGLQNVETHIERVNFRANTGGHFIPEDTIRKRFENAQEQLDKAFGKSDNFHYYNNMESTVKLSFEKTKENDYIVSHDNTDWTYEISERLGKLNQLEIVNSKTKIELAEPGRQYTGEITSIDEERTTQVTKSGVTIIHETQNLPGIQEKEVGKSVEIDYSQGEKAIIKDKSSGLERGKEAKLEHDHQAERSHDSGDYEIGD